MKFISLICISLLIHVSCISRTVITASDPEAEISVPREEKHSIGKLDYRSRGVFWETTEIKVQKNGCKPSFYKISKIDEFYPEGFFLGTVTYGLGLLWIGSYLPSYNLDYVCKNETQK